MSKYEELFFPATNTIDEFNKNAVFVGMLIVAFLSVIYIVSSFKRLKIIFKSRDNSLRQNSYIFFKIVSMLFLAYVTYEIVNIILSIA